MKPAVTKTAAIVGVSVLSIGLVVGTGFAANAATGSLASAIHRSVTSAVTPTPIHTHGPHGNDANGNDPTEHPTPEPGDDNAPGTPDHHGGKAGQDDNNNDNHGANRGPGTVPAPAPVPAPSSGNDDGPGHDAGDDNSNDGSGHESSGHAGSGHDGGKDDGGHDATDND